jgi:Skp family chaperone for outer membrane proteins
MKKLLTILATMATMGLAMTTGTAFAADSTAAVTPSTQQSKMKTCNMDAKEKKGDERKAFMKECLSAKPAAAEPAAGMTTQQSKMKTCNADAKTKALKGAERKAFMKECLSSK